MKAVFFLLIQLTILMGCKSSAQTSINDILFGLEKSYVKNSDQRGHPSNSFLEEYNITLEQFKDDSIKYFGAIKDFYTSPPDVISKLITFEKDTAVYCNWIKTIAPYSSTINKNDLVSKSKAALILIDCYILADSSKGIYLCNYIDKISFKSFVKFYQSRKDLSRQDLRSEYLVFVSQSGTDVIK